MKNQHNTGTDAAQDKNPSRISEEMLLLNAALPSFRLVPANDVVYFPVTQHVLIPALLDSHRTRKHDLDHQWTGLAIDEGPSRQRLHKTCIH